jgi:hypothetical protein
MLLLPLLLSLPVCVYDRSVDPELKASQLMIVADAIEAVTDDPEEQAALVTIAWFESRLCLHVHSGAVRGGQGRGLWQIEPGSNRVPPFVGLGPDATEHAAGQALWLWKHARCGRRPGLAARFGAYAGLGCGRLWAGAAPRARFMGWALSELAKG